MKSITFDIETVPQDEAKLLANAPEFTAAANLKDPEKIAASIAKKKADYLANAALDWKTAHIVLIGAIDDSGNYAAYTGDEKEVVGKFLAVLSDALGDGCVVGGHNVKGFDLPMLVNRARVLGLRVPPHLLINWKGRMQWHDNVFDTLELLSFNRAFDDLSCDAVAKAFGLPAKLGHGSDFPLLWRTDYAGALAYNQRDIEIEVGIARACGVI